MKKFLSVIAIFLVLAMTALSFSSCANIFISEAALAAISERILEGVNKISSAKALDADIKASMSFLFPTFLFCPSCFRLISERNSTSLTQAIHRRIFP